MRVALVNEGTYPFATGGVSTWCDQLIRGTPEVQWDLVTVVGTSPATGSLRLPGNVSSLVPVPIWSTARPPKRRNMAAASAFLQGMLSDQTLFREALKTLALAGDGRHPLHGLPLSDLLLDAWARYRGDRPLPPMSLRDADEAAVLIEHSMRPLAVTLPKVDVCHANANGLASLIALAAKWRTETPFIMTEHGVYLRERYLSARVHPPAVKAAMLRFHKSLAQLAYAEAEVIAPVSSFNRRWEVRHGADPSKIVVIPNGVDPQRFAPVNGGPEAPTISWVGRIDPLKDLETLIRALAVVRQSIPDARLHLAGPVPAGNESYARVCRDLVTDLRLSEAVTFAGPVSSSREAFAAGHLAALSSISEGMPYTVVEAMMCERPTVSTDVGGVAELVHDTGIVVPPRDPAALASGCVTLLSDPALRITLAAKGRVRALDHYTLDRTVDAYRRLYAKVVGR